MKIEFSSQGRDAFVLDHHHGRPDVTCLPAIRVRVGYVFESGKKKMGIKKYPDTYERGVAFSVVHGGLGSFIKD